MPSKYTHRSFVEGGLYHIFNRGNARKIIFREKRDYIYFLSLLACYVGSPKERNDKKTRNFFQKIDLLSFCLMPNHFHLCIQQHDERSMAECMRCIIQSYSRYYNKKYKSVGHVFQDKYKARILETDVDVIHVTRYIHANPKNITVQWQMYPYSSFQYYVRGGEEIWLNTRTILNIFRGMFGNSIDARGVYRLFVESYVKVDITELAPKWPK